ncbi:MAG: ATP-binding protein [Chloroflexi bacterium]|nr:ATP-binding protein [Chloroflexota bacterium]
MAQVSLQTGPGVFEVLCHVCRSPQEALKQFVENSADAIEQAGETEGYISVQLQYRPPVEGEKVRSLQSIVVKDNGTGMDRAKLAQVVQRIGDSEKLELALRGEKGIGILAFGEVAEELHLSSTASPGTPSSCLVLKREWLREGRADIVESCPRHAHTERGTWACLEGMLPEVQGVFTPERLKDHLSREFSQDLRRNLYSLSLREDGRTELVNPRRLRGVKVLSTPLSEGHAYVELYVLPWEAADASVNLYSRGGMRVCFLTDLEEFKLPPWADKRLEGYIRCDRLKRTADKTALVQDQAYRSFVSSLQGIEAEVRSQVDTVSAEYREARFNEVANRAARLIDRFVRYRERGETLELVPRSRATALAVWPPPGRNTAPRDPSGERRPRLNVTRAPHIQLYAPPQDKSAFRSWFDPQGGVICVNRDHAEFLLSEKEDRRCIRYLFSIWAKENLLQEYGADAHKVADEMVGVLAEAEPLLW